MHMRFYLLLCLNFCHSRNVCFLFCLRLFPHVSVCVPFNMYVCVYVLIVLHNDILIYVCVSICSNVCYGILFCMSMLMFMSTCLRVNVLLSVHLYAGCLFVYMNFHIYLLTCITLCVSISIFLSEWMSANIYTYLSVCMCLCIYVGLHVRISVWFVSMHVCVCVWVCVPTHASVCTSKEQRTKSARETGPSAQRARAAISTSPVPLSPHDPCLMFYGHPDWGKLI